MRKRRNAAFLAGLLLVSLLLSGCGRLEASLPEYYSDPGPVTTEPETQPPTTEAAPPTETTEETTAPTEPDPYETVPLLHQTDVMVPFGGGIVHTHGCGITCLAMLSSYYYRHDYTVEEMARWFNISKNNPALCMEYGIEQMGLPVDGPYYGDISLEKCWEALEEGKLVIVLMQQGSMFTRRAHFLIITGINEDGLYMVNDPNRKNYESDKLKDKYVTGFTQGEMIRGFVGCYIFPSRAEFDPDPATAPDFDN